MAEESVDIIVLVVSVDIIVAVSVLIISVDSVVVSAAGLESQAEKATVPRTMADITNNFFMVIMDWGEV